MDNDATPESSFTVLQIYGCSTGIAALLLLAGSKLLDNRISKSQLHFIEVVYLVLLWYGISVTFTLWNKWFFDSWNGGGFQFPIITSLVHMIWKYAFSRIYIHWIAQGTIHPLSSESYYRHAVPVGIATSLDVALGNVAFLYITVTFYTIIKSTLPIFVLIFGIMFGLEKSSCRLIGIIILISVGVVLATSGETQFSLPGFIFVLSSAACGGFRWSLTQLLLKGTTEALSSMEVLYHISLASILALIPFAIALELKEAIASPFLNTPSAAAITLSLVSFGGLMTFTMLVVQLQLVKKTSSLTLGVMGHLKEVVQITLSIITFSDNVTWLHATGLALALLGTMLYKQYKAGQANQAALASISLPTSTAASADNREYKATDKLISVISIRPAAIDTTAVEQARSIGGDFDMLITSGGSRKLLSSTSMTSGNSSLKGKVKIDKEIMILHSSTSAHSPVLLSEHGSIGSSTEMRNLLAAKPGTHSSTPVASKAGGLTKQRSRGLSREESLSGVFGGGSGMAVTTPTPKAV